jgi:hypothetical protein
MSAAFRLFAIESRRTFALWLVPVIVAASWLVVSDPITTGIALWVDVSVAILNSVIFAGPLIAGAAAWMAGREQRLAMGELLGTTPRPAIARDLASWSATASAGVVAYGLVVLYVAAMTMTRPSWGQPYWGPIAVGLLAMVAHAATGYAFGRFIRSRYTAPILAILLFLGQVYVGWMAGGNPLMTGSFLTRLDSLFGELRFLSPVANTQHDVFYGIWPNMALSQSVWLAGVAALALSLVALRDQRTLTTVTLTVAALILAVGGGAATAMGSPNQIMDFSSNAEEAIPRVPYELACAEGTVTICVHPAFAHWLPELTARADRVLAPIAGFPGVPTVAEQWGPESKEAAGHVGINIDTYESSINRAVGNIESCALYGCGDPEDTDGSVKCPDQGCTPPPGDPETTEVIHRWLWQQAGLTPPEYEYIDSDPSGQSRRVYDRLTPYVDRFAALSPEEQRAWLEANFAALQAGELTLDDLP